MKKYQKQVDRLKELISQKISNIHSDRCGLAGSRKGVLKAYIHAKDGHNFQVRVSTAEGASKHPAQGLDYGRCFAFKDVYHCDVYCQKLEEGWSIGLSQDWMELSTKTVYDISASLSLGCPPSIDIQYSLNTIVKCSRAASNEVSNAIAHFEIELCEISSLEWDHLSHLDENRKEKGIGTDYDHDDMQGLLIRGYVKQNDGDPDYYQITDKGIKSYIKNAPKTHG